MKLVEDIRAAYLSAIDRERKSIFQNNGTKDEYLAIVYATEVNLKPTDDEIENPARYGTRLLADLESAKDNFRRSEIDEHGFGIATLHSISRSVADAIAREI